MRRFLLATSALWVLGAVVGCNHTSGVCDCPAPNCCGSNPYGAISPMPAAAKPEPAQMPKLNGDAAPAAIPAKEAEPVKEPEKDVKEKDQDKLLDLTPKADKEEK